MSRYLVSVLDREDGHTIETHEGHVKVEGGALVFRHQIHDIDPYLMIAPGQWAQAWIEEDQP